MSNIFLVTYGLYVDVIIDQEQNMILRITIKLQLDILIL